MQRRNGRRTGISLVAEVRLDGIRYAGFLENLSERGICVCMEPSPSETITDFIDGTTLQLNFKPPLESALYLNCKVKWTYKNPPYGFMNSIGMEIVDPPPHYRNFFEQCYRVFGSY